MCGIAGILNIKGNNVGESHIRKMTCELSHRGPNADGFFVENEVALGHRRLSIIDLSTAANQPLFDNSGRYAIIFNGEMYNFMEVKAMLPDYHFKTSGDTEVLLAAFAKWGVECVNYFKGMFAFAIWDKSEKQLTVVRDRMGVKPVYYYVDDEHFLFASEIRSILSTGLVKRKLNRQGIAEYFSYQSINFPLTAIEGIRQIKAGNYLTIRNGAVSEATYWDVTRLNAGFAFRDLEAVKAKIRELLLEAVKIRLVSDVPVGAFLSGGIDSSVIVGLMAETGISKPNTFNISFEDKEYDESKYAETIARKFNTHHTRIDLKPNIFLEELENALNSMDVPSGDGINTYVVSKAIKNAGITVALSGVGGDELFAGYPLFNQFLRLQRKKSLFQNTGALRKLAAYPLKYKASNRTQRIRQVLTMPSPSIEHVYPVSRQILSPWLMTDLTSLGEMAKSTSLRGQLNEFSESIHRFPLLSQVSVAEYMGYTQHTLLKDTDQMSMAVSLEIREPFFDHELVEFVLAIPDEFKTPVYPKSLLVESVKPLLPDEIVHRKKQGFLLPWNNWMKKELKAFCEKRIINIAERSFIKQDNLLSYWRRFLNGDPSVRWAELWLFIVLEHWMERNNIEE